MSLRKVSALVTLLQPVISWEQSVKSVASAEMQRFISKSVSWGPWSITVTFHGYLNLPFMSCKFISSSTFEKQFLHDSFGSFLKANLEDLWDKFQPLSLLLIAGFWMVPILSLLYCPSQISFTLAHQQVWWLFSRNVNVSPTPYEFKPLIIKPSIKWLFCMYL